MKIEKATEILLDLDTTLPQSDPEERREAVKLGIEALKFRQACKARKIRFATFPLPGETEE